MKQAMTAPASLLIFFLLLAGFVEAGISFPQLTGRVVDRANMVNADSERQLEHFLEQHEQQTTNQVVVVTINSLSDNTIEHYGNQLFRHWGIGQKDKNNGVLLLVAKQQRKVRIEVGYGLEGTLTDARAAAIIQRVIVPNFKKSKFNTGITEGAKAIVSILAGEAVYQLTPEHNKQPFPWGMVIILGFIAICCIGAVIETIEENRKDDGTIDWKRFWKKIGNDIKNNDWSGRSSGGGYGFGGGGFSGGGGSSGGGGASGGW